jgi:Domain of unknown function (DUF4111)
MNAESEKIPEPARTAWLRLRDGLRKILGDDLVAMWAHGGTLALSHPRAADLDTHVILARRPDGDTAKAIEQVHDTIVSDLGVEWDAWYITARDARRSEPPPHAFREGRRDTSWAMHRAHWLAGRYWLLHGSPPAEIVSAPAWHEIEAELDRELEHLEAHVAAGDTDPYEATYAVLNGSRILRALATRDVVIAKGEAGNWALEHLPDRWHPLLRAALRSYEGGAAPDDAALLATGMAPFVAMVRGRLPGDPDRPAGSAPRWSSC